MSLSLEIHSPLAERMQAHTTLSVDSLDSWALGSLGFQKLEDVPTPLSPTLLSPPPLHPQLLQKTTANLFLLSAAKFSLSKHGL